MGKWHLGDEWNTGPTSPLGAGWSHFSGSLSHAFRRRDDYFRWTKIVNGATAPCCSYNTSEIVDDSLRWIKQQRQPWMCCVSFNAAHAPWHAPPPHLHSYDLSGLSPHRHPRAFYLAAIQAMDSELGRLFCGLGPQMDNTVVLFVGDNGSPGPVVGPPYEPMRKIVQWGLIREKIPRGLFQVAMGSHRAKGSLYQAGIRVPLVVAGPLVHRPGREVAAPVHTVDLFATILELAGIQPTMPESGVVLDSVSLIPYLLEPDQAPLRNTVYAERFLKDPSKRGASAISDGRYKLIVNRTGKKAKHELFDLLKDPMEHHNLLASGPCTDGHQRAYRALLDELNRLRTSEPGLAAHAICKANRSVPGGESISPPPPTKSIGG